MAPLLEKGLWKIEEEGGDGHLKGGNTLVHQSPLPCTFSSSLTPSSFSNPGGQNSTLACKGGLHILPAVSGGRSSWASSGSYCIEVMSFYFSSLLSGLT